MKRFWISFALMIVAALTMAQSLRIYQYPNTATLADTDMFIISTGGGNKQINWRQLKALSTNALSTNFSLTVNSLTVNSNFTVLGDTYIVNSNLYVTTTNVTINTNTTINAQTIFNGKVTINTNVYYGTNASSIFSIVTNTPTGTNIIVDMDTPCQTIDVTGNLHLLQTTNRPVDGKFKSCLLRLRNFNGSDYTLSHNTNAVWPFSGASLPATITNGTWTTVCVGAWGNSETNVSFGLNTWKPQQ